MFQLEMWSVSLLVIVGASALLHRCFSLSYLLADGWDSLQTINLCLLWVNLILTAFWSSTCCSHLLNCFVLRFCELVLAWTLLLLPILFLGLYHTEKSLSSLWITLYRFYFGTTRWSWRVSCSWFNTSITLMPLKRWILPWCLVLVLHWQSWWDSCLFDLFHFSFVLHQALFMLNLFTLVQIHLLVLKWHRARAWTVSFLLNG